jgi:hypothetical protein
MTIVSIVLSAHALAPSKPNIARATAPGVFDGQYLPLNPSNLEYTEWWWAQAIAEPVGNNPPAAFQVLFNEGMFRILLKFADVN